MDETREKLAYLSRNQCAFPGCSNVIRDPKEYISLGNICHISGFDTKHHRFDSDMTNEQRRSYDNLILLCGQHHPLVDKSKEESGYSISYVKEMKKQHETGLNNDIIIYTDTPKRLTIKKRVAKISGFIGIPMFLSSFIFSTYEPNSKMTLINITLLLTSLISIIPITIYIAWANKNEGYLFESIFTHKNDKGDLILYSKTAKCIYCNGGVVLLKNEKIDNKTKLIGTCNTCMSKYTYENNNIGRQLPYISINVNSK